MLSDIEIAKNTHLDHIEKIADQIGISDHLELYGDYIGKVPLSFSEKKPRAKLVLITAITPTPAGEGKSTITIGLGQALNRQGKKAIVCIREPSLGPVFGIKGGAAGGGYCQVLPMEDINLHFTGDMHAITSANNLISAAIDNHTYHGNSLGIDEKMITWKRCLDMNDRALRKVMVGLSDKKQYKREDNFKITVASELMAVLCLAESIHDLKERISKIIVAYGQNQEPITVSSLKITGAVAALLKHAIKPNLVQTIEHTPALVHGGPFANIAHGCNSLIATKTALALSDIVVTEAGFGADLGAEKFFNIKCRIGNLKPDAVVIVATIRALRMHGDGNVQAGLPNLEKHIENINHFGINPVVAINRFPDDADTDIALVRSFCQKSGIACEMSDMHSKGSDGGTALAETVISSLEKRSEFKFLYKESDSIKEKIDAVATKIYGAKEVRYTEEAEENLRLIDKIGASSLPICMAKTQKSLSDDPRLIGRPKGFSVTIQRLAPSTGAGFIVAYCGDIMTMPGLPKIPSAEKIDIDDGGHISGLF